MRRPPMDHHTKAEPCPSCGHLLEAAMNARAGRKPPVEGDVTVCMYCANPLMFRADLSHRLPTPEEGLALARNPELQRIRSIIKAAIPQ